MKKDSVFNTKKKDLSWQSIGGIVIYLLCLIAILYFIVSNFSG